MKRFSLLSLICVLCQPLNGHGFCVDMDECPPMKWMDQNKNSVPRKSSADVEAHIQANTCGGTTRKKKVMCLEFVSDEYGDDLYEGIHFLTASDDGEDNECSGFLNLYFIVRSQFIGGVRLSGTSYWNLENFNVSRRSLVQARTTGFCCWTFFEEMNYAGRSLTLPPNYIGRVNLNFKSVRRVSRC